MTNSVLYAIDGPVAIITLNRPERLNAMDQAMLDQLTAAADRAEQDDQIRAVVLTGAGNGFSSGFMNKQPMTCATKILSPDLVLYNSDPLPGVFSG